MSPFEDFDLDILKLQPLGGISPLDASDGNFDPGGSGGILPPPTVSLSSCGVSDEIWTEVFTLGACKERLSKGV